MHDKLIANYKAIFEKANNKPCPYTIEYQSGWFKFWDHPEKYYCTANYRASHMREMMDRLQRRIEKISSDWS